MPEMPEVETIRLGLVPVMEGRRIVAADIRRPDLRFALPPDMAARLTGARVARLGRRSKYILAGLSTDETLLMHMGMSGRLLVSGVDGPRAAPGKHDHVVLDLEGGARVTFHDARRFGMMDLVPTAGVAAHPLLANLGPEPLGNHFNAGYLAARLAGRRVPMKSALLDQRIVAGLGNIYVCEALHRAHVHPERAAGSLDADEIAALVAAIHDTLRAALGAGGSTLRDYRGANGELGYFQHAFRVYDRAGQPCPSPDCPGTIERRVQSGRSTWFCPVCQR
ncbi:MAG: bifunctional DNA-formamidopyrimidine glycosylase/DNA-(apurinic or apyrimidinic site) lyase [Rubellimicrobium sp.]|nr:bifunctional DNA-formamidopyrimidine glycosylase/DNA-(apurinic or apyrimidinic site) lyase [Rubellimicrobium sp.]